MTMPSAPHAVVLAGGVSSERDVALGSGRACAAILARRMPTRLVEVTADFMPTGLVPERDVVFSTLHGEFGEDGGMQRLLDKAGIEYAGCDADSSALTFDKNRTKARAEAEGLTIARSRSFRAEDAPSADQLVAELGDGIVLKPARGGSSVGLAICADAMELANAMTKFVTPGSGEWLAEQHIVGREVTVGILGDRALPVVEIVPRDGVFDYAAKYTKGLTDYHAPADLALALSERLQDEATRLYRAAGCRDFARVDFMLTAEEIPVVLELNTLPGMKETSLLPMGAGAAGLNFGTLVGEMFAPALARWEAHYGSGGAA